MCAKKINSLITDYDQHLFNEGTHLSAYEKFGAHLGQQGRKKGVNFTVWAPNAKSVSVVGEFNNWKESKDHLTRREQSGIWEGFIPGVKQGQRYKYHIESQENGYVVDKADPYAFYAEPPPHTASIVWDISDYAWGDEAWMKTRAEVDIQRAPVSIYEMHLGSWRRREDGEGHVEAREKDVLLPPLSYRQLADELPAYLSEMGYTHVEFMPITEHPFDGSWGYQTTGYFAPTSRYGSPQDLMHLIDVLHQHGIGVILDWVPGHFPTDEHGLVYFDGTHLFEHADVRQGMHPDWGTCVFNYGRNEVRSFLLSSARFWLDVYHIDGLRVDAVASMLYLDYSREDGEWVANQFGGRENLEAISFLKRMNEVVYEGNTGTFTIAEESTAWPMVSRPTYLGGLGFGLKWNMGWMHDMLSYMSKDPIHRSHHHNQITFSLLYAFHENFILPFSHDEVVHGKASMLSKMPGDDWQKFANARLLYGYMYGHPGKKLTFMGMELGEWEEWNEKRELRWELEEYPLHRGLQTWIRDLNHLIKHRPALHEVDFGPEGFQWIDCNDREQSVICFARYAENHSDCVVAVCNFTPIVRRNYKIGLPYEGRWREILNSDSEVYGGSSVGNLGEMFANPDHFHEFPYSAELSLPPLGILFFSPEWSRF